MPLFFVIALAAAPLQSAPATQTCPDGSVIPAADRCPASSQAAANPLAGLETEAEHCENYDGKAGMEEMINGCHALLPRKVTAGQRAHIYRQIAAAEAQSNDYTSALSDVARGLAVPGAPSNAKIELLVLRGQVYLATKDNVAAARDFDEAIAAAPDQPDGLFERGKLAFSQKRYADARSDFTAALGLPANSPYRAMIYYNRAFALAALQDKPGAAADLEEAVRADPENIDAVYFHGTYAEDAGRYEIALGDYAKTTQRAPQFAGGFNALCWTLAAHLKREFDRARTACETAMKLAPNDPAILDSVGLVALQQSRWQDAWNAYDASAKLGATYASPIYGRGIAALRLGREAEGRADIAKATGLEPTLAAKYAGFGQRP